MKCFPLILALSAYAQITFSGNIGVNGQVEFGVQQIILPLEITSGANGVAADASPLSFSIPTLSDPTAATTLTLKVHNLRHRTMSDANGTGRVRLNGGSWVNIKDSNITQTGYDFGGVGGSANTITFTISVAGSTFSAGANTIQFGHRGTDGFNSGFRVLSISIKTLGGTELIRSGTFADEDPSTWTGPYSDGTNITAGQTLWETATLFFPFKGTTGVAHCNDCHAVGARDLKYFNYSNASIINRAMFHGLTENEGKQIASYVRSRSLTYSPYARPWNPPYQPGPGLDARGVYNWAAGAGVDAVATDAAVFSAIAPNNGAGADFVFTGAAHPINIRQVPLTFPLADWNQWLPKIHPVDAHGRSTFESNAFYTGYTALRSALAPKTSAALIAAGDLWGTWDNGRYIYLFTTYPAPSFGGWTETNVAERYGAQLWQMVKLWELHHEFELEPFSRAFWGRSTAEIWSWYTTRVFQASPRLNYIPPKSEDSSIVGMLNDTDESGATFGNAWYYLQIILHAGNGSQNDNNPVDWPYNDGSVKGMAITGRMPSMHLLNAMAGMQMLYMNTANTNAGYAGFPFQFIASEWWRGHWNLLNSTQRTAIFENFLLAWLDYWNNFTPSELNALGLGPSSAKASPDSFGGKIFYTIPGFRHVGVSQSTINALCDWADTAWTDPNDNWNALKTASCVTTGSGGSADISCTYP